MTKLPQSLGEAMQVSMNPCEFHRHRLQIEEARKCFDEMVVALKAHGREPGMYLMAPLLAALDARFDNIFGSLWRENDQDRK